MKSGLALLIGLVVPFVLVAGIVLLVPVSLGQMFGVSLRSWALFLCAPATSLLLWLCMRGEPR